MSRVVPSNRLRMLPVRRPATTRLLGPSPPRFPAAGAVRTIQRPAYRLPRRLKQDVSAVRGSSHDTAAFEVPQDAVTLLLAHKMLGIGAFRRFLAKIQCMGIRNFGDSRFDADELTAGARQAYAAVTSAAFGKEWERDHQLLRQLVSENVADRMIAAASHNLATSVTLHHMMHAEIIGARMTTDPTDPDAADSNGRPFPTRMFFDVRFLACESTFNTETRKEGDISFSASTWRFEGNIARVPEGSSKKSAADVTVEPIEPDWEVTKWETTPMISIPKSL